MENPIKMDDLGGKPTIFGNIHLAKLLAAFFIGFQKFLLLTLFRQDLTDGGQAAGGFDL